MYHFLIVEDEAEAAEQLRTYVATYAEAHDIEVDVRWERTAFDFVETKKHYDLVFLDIGLPGIDGMEAAELLRLYDDQTLLVFVTSLAQYAMRGYEVGALDFVLKPVSYRAVAMRLDRAIRILDRRVGKSVYLPSKYGARVIPLSSLIYVDVSGHDLTYHVSDGDPVVMRGTMSKAEESLGGQFIRVSNSCLVNADHIRQVDGPDVTMSNGDVLTMSRAKRKQALEALANYFGGNR